MVFSQSESVKPAILRYSTAKKKGGIAELVADTRTPQRQQSNRVSGYLSSDP